MSINTTWALTLSSIKIFVRNRQALFFTLFMPLIIMSIFGLIGFDRIPKIPVGIATSNPTSATQQFIDQLKDIPAFEVSISSESQERQALEEGDRAVVFIIPADTMPDPGLRPSSPTTIRIWKNTGQVQQAQTAITIMHQILDKTSLALVKAPVFFTLQEESIRARNVRYIDFLLPGIVALSIMQMCVFSVAFVFVNYKERGILKRLLATPMKPFQFVTANVITRLLVAVAQSAVLITVGILLFKTQVIGSYVLLLPVIILGAILFLGLGFTISGLAKTVESVPAVANIIVFPMLFLGGTFFPLDIMPVWVQHIVQFLPLTYLSDALREIMANGQGWSAIAKDVYFLAGWSLLFFILANFTFSFEEKRV